MENIIFYTILFLLESFQSDKRFVTIENRGALLPLRWYKFSKKTISFVIRSCNFRQSQTAPWGDSDTTFDGGETLGKLHGKILPEDGHVERIACAKGHATLKGFCAFNASICL